MLRLDYSEFYITNLCNFNCEGCNRFNNYAFAGNYRWNDYVDIYQQWADVLLLDRWAIMGGEPMMNPDYIDWMAGVSRLWPESTGEFVTNGYFLSADNDKFYQAVESLRNKVTISISLHNSSRINQTLAILWQWLHPPIKISRIPESIDDIAGVDHNWQQCYSAIKDPDWPDCNTPSDWQSLPDSIRNECETVHGFSPDIVANQSRWWQLVDANGVKVLVKPENFFHQASVKKTAQGFELHNSDAMTAHRICDSRHCHHFVAGKLYKCGPVALFPEFDRQFGLTLTDEDRTLIQRYRPGEVNSQLAEFIDNIDNPIPQCKFCPENFVNQEIFAQHGQKIKFYKRNDRK